MAYYKTGASLIVALSAAPLTEGGACGSSTCSNSSKQKKRAIAAACSKHKTRKEENHTVHAELYHQVLDQTQSDALLTRTTTTGDAQ